MRNRSGVAVGGRIVPRWKSQLARWECFAGYCTGEALHSSIAGLLQQLQQLQRSQALWELQVSELEGRGPSG
jgi:hypothetical protein